MKNLLAALRHPSEYEWLALRPWQRHSLVVGVAGVVYIAVGAVYVFTEPTAGRLVGLKLAISIAPIQVWGVAWVIVGLLAVISSRWPPASKKWGYTILSSLSCCWSAMYAVGVVIGAPTSGLSGALVWALVAFLWWGIAGLDNPDDLIAMVEDPERWTPTSDGD